MDRFKGKRIPFCRWYLALGNPAEAARRAGCDPKTAEQDGLELLHSTYCRSYLKRLAEAPPLPLRQLVTAGLTRLAFGSANDAARLCFAEELSDDALRGLDLFHVVSIRRDRNGFEVKLADRQHAMEKLLECAAEADGADAALLAALQGPQEGGNADDDLFPQAAQSDELVENAGNPES